MKTSYFSHDSNARNSEKIIRLRMKHGAAGYGVFFMILERLRDSDSYSAERDYAMLAFDFRVDVELVRSVVEDFGLFVISDERFGSESFNSRMAMKDKVSESRRSAAAKRWGTKSEGAEENIGNDADTMQPQCNADANAPEHACKESKVNERKVNKKNTYPPKPPTEGDKRDTPRCGEEYLNDILSGLKPDTLEKRVRRLNLSQERFRELALEVLDEWEDFGERSRNARHLFNQLRCKLRVDPSARKKPDLQAAAEYRAELRRKREEVDSELQQLREQVKSTGKTPWELYCESAGIDPATANAAQMALGDA